MATLLKRGTNGQYLNAETCDECGYQTAWYANPENAVSMLDEHRRIEHNAVIQALQAAMTRGRATLEADPTSSFQQGVVEGLELAVATVHLAQAAQL